MERPSQWWALRALSFWRASPKITGLLDSASFQPQIELRNSYLQDQRVYWLSLIGRLKSEVSLEQAQAEANLQLHQFLTQRAGSKLTDQVTSRHWQDLFATGSRRARNFRAAICLCRSVANADGYGGVGANYRLRQRRQPVAVTRNVETS